MKVILNPESAQQLLNYLASRPYGEVIGLINMIQKSVVEEDECKEECKTNAKK